MKRYAQTGDNKRLRVDGHLVRLFQFRVDGWEVQLLDGDGKKRRLGDIGRQADGTWRTGMPRDREIVASRTEAIQRLLALVGCKGGNEPV